MKRPALRLAIVLLFASLARTSPSLAAEFLPGFEDVPMMSGLKANAEPMRFDVPHGRIVSIEMTGRLERDAVVAFYRVTLRELGWMPETSTSFRRAGERLRLEFADRGGNLEVKFLLTPE
jgi:hypothetical protein